MTFSPSSPSSPNAARGDVASTPCAAVRQALLAREEIALLDVREEDPFAQEHPLWAANFPLSRLELQAWARIPRRDTRIVVYGEHDGVDLAAAAAAVLVSLGYTDVSMLEGGLQGWVAAGGEVFRDVNVPSKAFGELVEARRHTPSLPAAEVQALLDGGADMVVVDARRYDEYCTMSIPTATSVPGAELVLRVRELAPDPATLIVVNCAGRTRSIIGTQSLINAGLPNRIAALRNGTIGWTLAGQRLDHGATRRAPAEVTPGNLAAARAGARAIAQRAGVRRTSLVALATLEEAGRTVYRFDVRTPEEYAVGHLPGFASAPGGQLVQETDHSAPVRGARIVLADDDGVRADMTGSWLAQMGWEVWVVDPVDAADRRATGHAVAPAPQAAPVREVSPRTLAAWLTDAREMAGGAAEVTVIDVGPGAGYVKAHIPGAWFAIRAQLGAALARLPAARRYVITCGDGELARFAAVDAAGLLARQAAAAGEPQGQDDSGKPDVFVLAGGTAAWIAQGLPVEAGETRLATARTDRYRRPYEGTDNASAAMQAYLDWEFGLVAQLGRDGTHFFHVV